jgi:hypothetical protein
LSRPTVGIVSLKFLPKGYATFFSISTPFEINSYPNPFNPSTVIEFSLPEPTTVTLAVYNILGQIVSNIDLGQMAAGSHSITWDGVTDQGESVSTGIYFYRIQAGDYSESRKMMILK